MACSDLLGSAEAINQIVVWLHQAGQIALNFSKAIEPHIKPDDTLLTEADLMIEQFLSERLQAAYPNDRLIGEEQVHPNRSNLSANVWVIDPIDGTTAFVQGLPGWGISVGLLHQGQPCLGFFYMPMLDDMTYISYEGHIYTNTQPLAQFVRQRWQDKDFLAITATAHHDFHIHIPRTRALGSISANLVYTARGTSAAAFIPKAHLWDLAAGSAILTRAGGELRYLSGRPVDYLELLDGRLIVEPLIASHPDMQAEIRAKIEPRDHSNPG